MSEFIASDFLDWLWRLLLAQGIIILFLLLNLVSFSMPHAGDFKPFFLLMAVYYWAIYRPTVMPVGYTFILGLIIDLQANLPLGMTALILVGLQTLVHRSRLFLMGQQYVMVWLGFSIVAAAYAISVWLLISLANFTLMPASGLIQTFIAALLSVMIFPLASLPLQGVHRLLPVSSGPLRTVR